MYFEEINQLLYNLCSLIIYIYYQILFKETIAGPGAKEIWDLAIRCERIYQDIEDLLYQRRLSLATMPAEQHSRRTFMSCRAQSQYKSSTR